MFEEMERLTQDGNLYQLLGHYAIPGSDNRETWHDRIMELGDLSPMDLVHFHGELIAYGWIEQNSGVVPVLRPGAVPDCYRVTVAGLRAFKRTQAGRIHEEDETIAA